VLKKFGTLPICSLSYIHTINLLLINIFKFYVAQTLFTVLFGLMRITEKMLVQEHLYWHTSQRNYKFLLGKCTVMYK
jgi:hypothetical protein